MTIQVPNLDDRTFEDLVREGLSLLPAYAPRWTNHNPSDPGITLIELLAYFTEILVYRLGRVSPASKLQFLRLLQGAKWDGWRSLAKADADELRRTIEDAVRELAHVDCAVTPQDFERLAINAAAAHLRSSQPVRALCAPEIDLESGRVMTGDPANRADVTVVVVPRTELPDDAAARLREAVRKDLLSRCLLATRLHVVGPVYLYVAIGFKLARKPGRSMQSVKTAVGEALHRRFGSGVGEGPQGAGWAFGRPLHISEVVEAIDQIPEVDYVEDVTVVQLTTQKEALATRGSSLGIQIGLRSTLGVDSWLGGPPDIGPDRVVRDESGRLVSIILRPWELLGVTEAEDAIVDIDSQRSARTGNSRGRDHE